MYVATVIKVTTHIPHESSIDYLEPRVVFGQTEHVASKVELFLPHIRHSFTDNFSNVLSDNGVLFGEGSDEEAESIDFGRCHIDFIGGFFEGKVIFFLGGRCINVCQILFDVFESNKGGDFGLELVLLLVDLSPLF